MADLGRRAANTKVHGQGDGNLEPGDSGGPLFWLKSDGTRQVLGVAGSIGVRPFAIDGFDCTFNKCDFWTDVTRGATADWIRNQMEDRSRSVAWLQAHQRAFQFGPDGILHPDYWKGEVDYTGPCDIARDADCDHWYNEHDNCPTFYNPAQIEGTICPPPPPPPPPASAPQNCTTMNLCRTMHELRSAICSSADDSYLSGLIPVLGTTSAATQIPSERIFLLSRTTRVRWIQPFTAYVAGMREVIPARITTSM